MKKLLGTLSSLVLSVSTVNTSILTVACQGVSSRQINSILELDKETFFNLPEFNYDFMCPPIYYKARVNSQECLPENPSEYEPDFSTNHGSIDTFFFTSYDVYGYLIETDRTLLETSAYSFARQALGIYQTAISWFNNLLSSQTIAWYNIVYSDFQTVASEDFIQNPLESDWFYEDEMRYISSELNPDARRRLLYLLGDEILTLDFQRNVAIFAVLRKNLNLLYEGYRQAMILRDNFEDNYNTDELIELNDLINNLQTMISEITMGRTIPLFKLVAGETARSMGSSQINIRFDKNLVSYLNVGSRTQDDILDYYSFFPDIFDPENNKYIYQRPRPQDIIRFAQSYRDEEGGNSSLNIQKYITDFNLRERAQMYLYGWEFQTLVERTVGGTLI